VRSEQIVGAAAKLIVAQIREIENNTDFYPMTAEMKDDGCTFIPPVLKILLSVIIAGSRSLKRRSFGEAIVQASRP